jgi:hypothetical protein
LISSYAEVHDRHLYSKTQHKVVEKEEEVMKGTANSWLIFKVKDIDHEQNHWYKLGLIGLYHKHYKGPTYNVLIEWYNGETANDALNVKVADEINEGQFFPVHDWVDSFLVGMISGI